LTAQGVRFPVAIIHYSAPPMPGESGRVAAGHARALAREGYPVRLVTGARAAPSAGVDVRYVPELFPAHSRIRALNSALLRGEAPDDLEPCILDVAQGIGRELVGCGTVFVHDLMTTPWNLAATEALWRIEKGSRRPGIPGSPTRRWVVWANALAGVGSGSPPKKRPWSLMGKPLPGARYVVPSKGRRAEVAKALGIAQRGIEVVGGGVDVAAALGLTANVRSLVDDAGLLAADAILFTPSVAADPARLERALEMVKAMTRANRGLVVRWLVAGRPDPREPSFADGLAKLIAKRDKLGLGDSVRFLSTECEWARDGMSEEDRAALHRLADAILLAGGDDCSGLSVLEGALAGSLVILTATASLKELVKDEKGVIALSPRARPAPTAKRILNALASAPGAGLRRRARQSLSWDALARDYLVPLAEGKKIKAKSKAR